MSFSITNYQITALETPHQNNFTSIINFNVQYNENNYSLAYYCADGYGEDPDFFAIDELNPGAYMLTEPPLSEYEYLPQEAIDELTLAYIYEQLAIDIFFNATQCSNLGYLQGTLQDQSLDPIFYRADYDDMLTKLEKEIS